MPLCRSCHRPVIWATVAATGRRMPLDATPAAEGNVALDGPRGSARAIKKGEEYSGLRYVPHHATCPDGPAWRGQSREQLRLAGVEEPGRPAQVQSATPQRRGAAAAAGYSATTPRVWVCPGCKQPRSGKVCKDCREARPAGPGRPE